MSWPSYVQFSIVLFGESMDWAHISMCQCVYHLLWFKPSWKLNPTQLLPFPYPLFWEGDKKQLLSQDKRNLLENTKEMMDKLSRLDHLACTNHHVCVVGNSDLDMPTQHQALTPQKLKIGRCHSWHLFRGREEVWLLIVLEKCRYFLRVIADKSVL